MPKRKLQMFTISKIDLDQQRSELVAVETFIFNSITRLWQLNTKLAMRGVHPLKYICFYWFQFHLIEWVKRAVCFFQFLCQNRTIQICFGCVQSSFFFHSMKYYMCVFRWCAMRDVYHFHFLYDFFSFVSLPLFAGCLANRNEQTTFCMHNVHWIVCST